MKRIFFVAYGAGHIAMLLPIINMLRKLGTIDLIILGLTTAQQKLDSAGIPYIGYSDLAKGQSNYLKVKESGERLAADLPPGPVSIEESIAYLGINYTELVDTMGEHAAAERYAAEGRHAFLPIRFMRRVLAAYKPDLVVATNSPRTERAAVMAAGELGIPSICLVDLFALQEVAWIGVPGYADRICVLSTGVKEMFVAHGRNESEVFVTGNPAFDALVSTEVAQSRESIRRAHGWSTNEKIILCASQVEPFKHPFADIFGDPALPRDVERALARIVAKRNEYRLIFRRHPSESVEYTPLQERIEVGDKTEHLPGLLHSVDLVVVTASTVGLEAAMIGKPVVSVDMSVFTSDAPYSKMGISLGVENLDDLEDAVEKALAGAAPNGAVYADGKATERVVSHILELLQESGETSIKP